MWDFSDPYPVTRPLRDQGVFMLFSQVKILSVVLPTLAFSVASFGTTFDSVAQIMYAKKANSKKQQPNDQVRDDRLRNSDNGLPPNSKGYEGSETNNYGGSTGGGFSEFGGGSGNSNIFRESSESVNMLATKAGSKKKLPNDQVQDDRLRNSDNGLPPNSKGYEGSETNNYGGSTGGGFSEFGGGSNSSNLFYEVEEARSYLREAFLQMSDIEKEQAIVMAVAVGSGGALILAARAGSSVAKKAAGVAVLLASWSVANAAETVEYYYDKDNLQLWIDGEPGWDWLPRYVDGFPEYILSLRDVVSENI